MTARRFTFVPLIAVLVFAVWWRASTISGTIQSALGFAPYPVVAASEPLDCDECIYGYIGERIAQGDVMYRDLTENKPPLGYWIYALTVALGGANETAIRLMPVPMVLITITLVWWMAHRLAGTFPAAVAALIYALMSTDPFLYGNGANMEHAINLFAAASLAMAVRGWSSERRGWFVAAGVFVAMAAMVKQVAILPCGVFGLALLLRRSANGTDRSLVDRLRDGAALIAGVVCVVGLVVAVLAWQGALAYAYQDVILFGGALARDTPPDPKEYPFLVRWIVGNTDPNGLLPWPFGKTLGRAWWAAGSWPLWVISLPCTAWAGRPKASGESRLIAGWTVASWVAVAMPRLFWQHYFLLPLPGVALVVAIALGDAIRAIRTNRSPVRSWSVALLLLASVVATFAIQVREYLLVPPELITERDKGGRQWVVLRDFGRELGRRTRSWHDPKLWVWGGQSPLIFYSGLDSVTPQVFADPLTSAFAQGNHPQVRPRLERTLRDLRAKKPELIFVGQPPFPELSAFLRDEYLPSRLFRQGLWVRRDRFAEFEAEARD